MIEFRSLTLIHANKANAPMTKIETNAEAAVMLLTFQGAPAGS